MTNQTPSPIDGSGQVIATGITASILGGAISTVFCYWMHTTHPNFAAPPEQVDQALQTLFTTAVMVVSMVGHLLIRRLTK